MLLLDSKSPAASFPTTYLRSGLDNMNEGKEGASYVYPDSFVQLLGYMRAYFHLPYRQTDSSTIQRRIKKLDIKINELLGNVWNKDN